MIAAIYARKSTEQNVSEDAKSVTRQVDNAMAYAVAKGWAVSSDYVFIDDGKSGAEFERRKGLMRLRGLLAPRAPFQVLIVSEQKSLGREMAETAYLIKQLDEAGVEVWSYMEDRSLTPRDAVSKLMSSVQSFADEDHRAKTSMRVHEAHVRLHKKNRVPGGRVFGYRNIHVYDGIDADGNPKRSHTVREVHPDEATIVRRIYEMYDSGYGLKRIAKLLNAEHALAPRPFQRKDAEVPSLPEWSPSTVRAILCREIYRGTVVWNKTRKRTVWGKVRQKKRSESEWLRTSAEDLRIISDDLWNRARARRKETESRALRFDGGRMSGRPPQHAIKNLLAGLATCGLCGKGLVVETSPLKRGRVGEYLCSSHRRNGTCTNALHPTIESMNEAVLQAIEEHALTPDAIEQVIKLSERDDLQDQKQRIEKEIGDLDRRISRLVEAIEAGGDAVSLVAKLRELEAKKSALKVQILGLHPVPRLAPELVESRLAEWRRLLRGSTTQGRAVLQRILRGRIVFTPRPDGTGYEFSAPTRFDKLFTGIVVPRPTWLAEGDVRGSEHLRANDTFDADYGALLERVEGLASPPRSAPLPGPAETNGKGMASPSGIEPESRP